MKTYTLSTCENLISQYEKMGGTAITLQEGSLGLGIVLCYGENLKTAIIEEVYINCWASEYTITLYENLADVPQKYKNLWCETVKNPTEITYKMKQTEDFYNRYFATK